MLRFATLQPQVWIVMVGRIAHMKSFFYLYLFIFVLSIDVKSCYLFVHYPLVPMGCCDGRSDRSITLIDFYVRYDLIFIVTSALMSNPKGVSNPTVSNKSKSNEKSNESKIVNSVLASAAAHTDQRVNPYLFQDTCKVTQVNPGGKKFNDGKSFVRFYHPIHLTFMYICARA